MAGLSSMKDSCQPWIGESIASEEFQATPATMSEMIT